MQINPQSHHVPVTPNDLRQTQEFDNLPLDVRAYLWDLPQDQWPTKDLLGRVTIGQPVADSSRPPLPGG